MLRSVEKMSQAAAIGMSRDQQVQKVIADVNSVLALPTGAPSFDERIGSVKELELGFAEIFFPWLGPPEKTLVFEGDGGKYEVMISVVDPE